MCQDRVNSSEIKMTGGRILLLVLAGLGVVWLTGSMNNRDQEPKSANWKVIGGLTDGVMTKFVQMDPLYAMDRCEYDNAVNAVCREQSICAIAFFLPGDRVPTSQSSRNFFDAGGWANYPVLAMWWGNRNSGSLEYTKWDCDRAGAVGTPLSALCGAGVKEVIQPSCPLPAGRAWRKPADGRKTTTPRRLWLT